MKKPLLLTIPVLWLNAIIMLTSCPSRRELSCTYPYTGTLTVWNNADSTPRLADGDGVRAKALYLKLVSVDTYYICSRPTPAWPINAAYAQNTTGKAPRVQVDSTTITSDHDFDAAHPAGTDLASLFARDKTYGYYYLQYAPSDTGTHTFAIHFYMSDATKNLTITALPVKLLL